MFRSRIVQFGVGAAFAFAVAAGSGLGVTAAHAADHKEAPGTQADKAADLADVYVFHASGKLTLVMTFAGATDPADPAPTYDDDVLYTFQLDRTADFLPDVSVECRFGKNRAGAWGVQVKNIPGATGPVSGAVGQTIDAGNGIKVYAGFRDDPFFFDLDGFRATLATGTLSFDNSRDFFAGRNVTAIVIEMNAADATGTGNTDLNVWATTARKPS
ncbi:MAG: DUF4331 family protein [bacterium]